MMIDAGMIDNSCLAKCILYNSRSKNLLNKKRKKKRVVGVMKVNHSMQFRVPRRNAIKAQSSRGLSIQRCRMKAVGSSNAS